MKFAVILNLAAIEDLARRRKFEATMIADAIDEHLASAPQRESRSRIKRLRGAQSADFRLLVDRFRVFYTVDKNERTVIVLRILRKDETKEFYKEERS